MLCADIYPHVKRSFLKLCLNFSVFKGLFLFTTCFLIFNSTTKIPLKTRQSLLLFIVASSHSHDSGLLNTPIVNLCVGMQQTHIVNCFNPTYVHAYRNWKFYIFFFTIVFTIFFFSCSLPCVTKTTTPKQNQFKVC